GTDGLPILTRAINGSKPVPEKNSKGMDQTEDYDLHEVDPPDDEFTLTAFGLPEPVGMETKRSSRAYLWFGLAPAGALALGYLLRRAARRRAERSTRPVPSSPTSRS